MNLNDALTLIADQFHLDAQVLIEHAQEDNIGGWDADTHLYGWAAGSLWSVEGKVLYALVRALKPLLCVEFGTWHGCSASHIASALKANGVGKLICVDHGGFGSVHIAPDLLSYIEFKSADLFDYLQSNLAACDFIFEDAEHLPDQVAAVWGAAVHDGLLANGGMIVSHDAMHYLVGENVQAGIAAAGIEGVLSILIEPSDCGLAVWRKLSKTIDEPIASNQLQTDESPAIQKRKTRGTAAK